LNTKNADAPSSGWLRSLPFPLLVSCYATILIAGYARLYFFLFDDTALVATAIDTPAAAMFSLPLIGFYRPMTFLLLKLQASMFGWHDPAGYAAVAVLVHAASVVAFHALLGRFGLDRLARGIAAALFLASPWATEATFWLSSAFDLYAVFLSLLSLLAFCRFLERQGPAVLLVATLLFGMALLCKENAVTFGAVFAAVAANKAGERPLRTLIIALAPIVGVTLAYLAARWAVIPQLGGAYGTAGELFRHASILRNLGSYLQNVLVLGPKLPPSLSSLGFGLYFAGVLICLAAALTRPRLAATCLSLFVILLAPVLWIGMSVSSTVSSRLLYAPALPLLALVGVGAAVIWRWLAILGGGTSGARGFPLDAPLLRRAGQVVFVALIGATVGLAFVATFDQARLWRFAIAMARNTVSYLLADPALVGPAVHITNLPAQTVEGPYLLKTYNLHHHLAAAGRSASVDISADTVMVSARDPAVALPLGRDSFSGPRRPEATVITLPLAALRAAPPARP
jgi:hypothetical protein